MSALEGESGTLGHPHPNLLRRIIYHGEGRPTTSEKPVWFSMWWEKHLQKFENIDRPDTLHTPLNCVPITNLAFQILRDEHAVSTSWSILFPDIDFPKKDTSIPIIRIKDTKGVVRGYNIVDFMNAAKLEKNLSPDDLERIRLYYDVSTIIMGGADGYSTAESLVQRCIKSDYQQMRYIDELFLKRDFMEVKTLFNEQPNQILTYLIHTIVETHMIDPKNTPPETLSKLANLRKILRETNPSSIATDNTNRETNINDAMVYLQELWISRTYPHLFALGNEVVARKTGLPHEKRFCTMWTTRLMDRALHYTRIIDQDDQSFTIRANFKSGSSLILAVLSEQADFRESVFNMLTRFGIQTEEIRALKSPMEQAIKLLQPLENLITKPSGHAREVRSLIEEYRKRMSNKEYFVRCYALSNDNNRLLLALEKGKEATDAFMEKEPTIHMWANCVMKRQGKGWRQAFSYEDVQKLYNDLPENLRKFAPVWFLLDHIYQLPQDGTGFAMWYMHLPAKIEVKNGNRQLRILSPRELGRMNRKTKNDILWMEIELGTDLNALPANWTRSAWEMRQAVLHEGSMPDDIQKRMRQLQKSAHSRDHRSPDQQKKIPIPEEFYTSGTAQE